MAPKKNRIKLEQKLQGKSCPHPGNAIVEARATGRKGQKPKKLRGSWPGAAAPRQVKKLDNAIQLYTPFAPFVRLVKEITESIPSQVKRWTPEALLWLQDAAEFFLMETFDVELQLTIRQMHACSSLLNGGSRIQIQAAGEEGGEEHAGESPEETEEMPNGLVKRERSRAIGIGSPVGF